jgi:uncharacterized membrane protein YoaK (UPF0700 family)
MATALVAVLVAVLLAAVVGQPVSEASRYALIVPLAIAMGIQNATARRLAVPDLTTTVDLVLPLSIAAVVIAATALAAHELSNEGAGWAQPAGGDGSRPAGIGAAAPGS